MSTQSIAEALAQAHARGVQLETFGELRDAAQAYEVQSMVWKRIRPGARPLAWKAGTPRADAEPNAAPLLAVHRSPASLDGRAFHRIGVEAEVAYRFARDLPWRGAPPGADELAGAIAEACVAIEVCDTRLSNWRTAPELWKLADFQNNGCLVAGSGTAQWRGIDFAAQRAELSVDGRRLVEVVAAHPLGDPFRLLPWLAAHCARRGYELRAGDVVTTGAWGGMHEVRAGCEVVARFPGIGEATVRILA